jgi:hypothetical protein
MSTVASARRLIGRRTERLTSDDACHGLIANDRSGSIERIRVAQQRAQPGAAVVS